MSTNLKNTDTAYECDYEFSFPRKYDFINIIEKNNINAIVNEKALDDFVRSHPKEGNYDNIMLHMSILKKVLSDIHFENIDPVVYIMSLYYQDELGIRDITKKLNDFGINISASAMQNRLTKVFGWKLREKNTRTKVSNGKNKLKPLIVTFNKNRTGEIIENNRNIVKELISRRKDFDIKKYNECKNHQDRIAYIFSIHDIAETKEDVQSYIQTLQKGNTSMQSIAMIITELFRNSIQDIHGINIPKLGGSEINKMYFR